MHETILVVDDEPQVVVVVAALLESLGQQYRVRVAVGGPDALAVEQAVTGSIDLLLTDIVMPGLNGPELAAKLLERRPTMKVLYMSGSSRKDLYDQTHIRVPDMPILSKPFTVETLANTVHDVLTSSPSASAGRPSPTSQRE